MKMKIQLSSLYGKYAKTDRGTHERKLREKDLRMYNQETVNGVAKQLFMTGIIDHNTFIRITQGHRL